jgi:CO/xanthine dehydrogenase FAD-binding subunit
MLLNAFTFHAPESLKELTELYTSLNNVRLQAGGTFLLNSLKLLKRNGAKTPENVISLNKVKELKGISENSNELVIKSMTTITDLFESNLLKDNFSIFRIICRNISTTPIRNMATVGGNLSCRYTWTEMPAVMIALNATLHFSGKGDQTGNLPSEEFFKNGAKTDKILTHITIPRDKKSSCAYQRVKKTQYVDIPLLSLCMTTTFEDNRFTKTRVSINNCVAFAQRDKILEDFLNTHPISPTIAVEALNHVDNTIYDDRSSDYKKHMFRHSLKSAIEELKSKRNSFISAIRFIFYSC